MPAGWLEDEPQMVSDPDSVMPDDWDEDMDGKFTDCELQLTTFRWVGSTPYSKLCLWECPWMRSVGTSNDQ